MNDSILDAIVIGAGHAGLSISYHLSRHHLNHVIIERGKIGESWRAQRWDTFRLNTANKVNLMPGEENVFADPEGFCSAIDFASFLESYARKFQLPVIEHCKAISVEKAEGSPKFSVSVKENGVIKNYQCHKVIVASGGQNEIKIPPFAKNISSHILQLHASEYRNGSSLPEGAVLVVGSAQSGVQVAEDLVDAGREVFLSTSQVARIPRRYRDKDIVDWLISMGFYNLRTEDVTDPQVLKMKVPQVSGVGVRGHSVSLQDLARRGVVILGKMENADKENAFIQLNAIAHVKFGDEFSGRIKNMVDDFIKKSQIDASPAEADLADLPDMNASCASSITSLNLKENNITSIIWTTGFGADFSYLKPPVHNNDGTLKHRNGISEIEGLYFIGLPWLRNRKSGIILGIREDAEFIANEVCRQL